MELLPLIASLGLLIPVGLIGFWRYSVWLLKRLLSSRWEDIHTDEPLDNTRLGVAVTVKGEPVDTFREVLVSQIKEGVDQVCITFDEGERECMAMTDAFARKYADKIDIRWEITHANGKRGGLMEAIAMVQGMDIIMCIDSDTVLGDGVKRAVLETFQEPNIGGATVRQRVKNPTLLPHFMFDIRLKLRYLQDIPGQALGGYVSCLSGRCSAYRADALQKVAPGLPHEHWAGIHKSGGGDDKFLTTAIHDLGYNTVAITDVAVYTRPEDDLQTYMNQSLRWARNSWFSDFRALFTREWMWENWILPFYTLDRIVSTFTMLLAMWFMAVLVVTGSWIGAGVLFIWWLLTRSIKIAPYLRETGKIHLLIPYLVMTLVIAILKVHALVTLWESGWLTRGGDSEGSNVLEGVLNTSYRVMTMGIVAIVGVLVFWFSGVFLSDIPVVAEAGNFYRAGEDGLQVADYLVVDDRPTTIVVPDDPNQQTLQLASQTAQRLSEEFVETDREIEVMWASDISEAEAESGNLIFIGEPPQTNSYTRSVRHLYRDPELGEFLADAQPFASADALPIRVLRSDEFDNQMLLVSDTSDTVRYRLRGDTMPANRALTTIDTYLGDAFTIEEGSRTDTLATWDARATNRTEEGALSRTYGITLAPTTVLDPTSSVDIQLPDDLPVQSESIIIRVNDERVGSLQGLTNNEDALSLPVAGINSALADQPLDQRILNLEVILQTTTTLDDDAMLHTLQSVEQNVYVDLVLSSEDVSLASYPYPYAQNANDTPVTIVLPQPIQSDDIRLMMGLSAQLASFNPDALTIQIATLDTLTREMLTTSNVIILGELERQPYARALDMGLQQTASISLYNRLPNSTTGLLYTLESPWNADYQLLVASGSVKEGYQQAISAMISRLPLLQSSTDIAFVPANENIQTLSAVDLQMPIDLNLENISISDALILPDSDEQSLNSEATDTAPATTTPVAEPTAANR